MIYSPFTAPHFPFSPLQTHIFFLLPPGGWGNPSSAAIPIHWLGHSVLPVSAHFRWLSVWCAQEDRFLAEKAATTHTWHVSLQLYIPYQKSHDHYSTFFHPHSKSLGPSGIFCSLCYCVEWLRLERMVDVFRAVQKMQLQRPGMVESVLQYAFIYDCMFEFIRTHSDSQ